MFLFIHDYDTYYPIILVVLCLALTYIFYIHTRSSLSHAFDTIVWTRLETTAEVFLKWRLIRIQVSKTSASGYSCVKKEQERIAQDVICFNLIHHTLSHPTCRVTVWLLSTFHERKQFRILILNVVQVFNGTIKCAYVRTHARTKRVKLHVTFKR